MPHLTYYSFSAAFNCVACFFCGAFVLWKNPKGEKNLSFIPLTLSCGLWSFFYAFWQLSQTPEQALLFIRLSIACVAFITPAAFQIYLVVLDASTPYRRKWLVAFYVIGAIIALSAPTPYFIPRVVPRMDFPFWPVPGFFIHLLFITECVPSLWSLYLIWEKGTKTSALNRNKLKWVFVGTIIGFAGAMSNNFLWYNIPIKPYINILSSIGVIIAASTFFRLGVTDFNYLLKRLAGRSAAIGVSMAIALVMLGLFIPHLNPVVLLLLSALIGAVLHPISRKLVEAIGERFLKVGWISTNTIQERREKLRESTYTYNDLARNLVDMTMSTFPVESAAVYFFDLNKQEFYLCTQKGMKNPATQNLRFNRSALAIRPDNLLVVTLESTKKFVHKEDLMNDAENVQAIPLITCMDQVEGEICTPFIFGDKLRGFMVVGHKKNNTLFNDEELENVVSFAAMGTEVMRYIMAMETELNHTALYSHDMNHDIRSLTQTLEFLGSPMAESQPKEKVKRLLDQAKDVSERLYESFQMNRDRSALIMKMIRGEYEKKPVNIAEVLKLAVGKYTLQAEEKKVSLVVHVDPGTPMVIGNELDLSRVVDNLINNAFRYISEENGRLEVTGRMVENQYEIRVKDNGAGINPADLEKIWQLGWQPTGDTKKGAAGFGLAIVKQIIQVHEGSIQAISQGKGTGVEFRILLPTRPSEAIGTGS